MSLSIAVQPYAEPITLAEMKVHLKVDADMVDDDALITSLIPSARDVVETGTGSNVARQQVMVDTTFQEVLDWFPCGNYIALSRVPLVSVSSITYVDTAGSTQTLSTDYYSVDLKRGRIYLTYSSVWPSIRAIANSVTVTYLAGMAASFTAATSDVLTIKGRTFTTGDRVRIMNSGGMLPPGLSALTDYFFIAGPKLSLTSGGSAVDVTSAGNGTHFVGLDLTGFETLRHAIKGTVGYWYQNRQSHVVIPGAGALELPGFVQALIAAQHAG